MTFTAQCASAAYTWNFGDGTTATGQSVQHVFAAGVVAADADDGRRRWRRSGRSRPSRCQVAGAATRAVRAVDRAARDGRPACPRDAIAAGASSTACCACACSAPARGSLSARRHVRAPARRVDAEARRRDARQHRSSAHAARGRDAASGERRARRRPAGSRHARRRTSRTFVVTHTSRARAGPRRGDDSRRRGRATRARAGEPRAERARSSSSGLASCTTRSCATATSEPTTPRRSMRSRRSKASRAPGSSTRRVWRGCSTAHTPAARYGGDHVEVDKTRQVLFIVRAGKVALIVADVDRRDRQHAARCLARLSQGRPASTGSSTTRATSSAASPSTAIRTCRRTLRRTAARASRCGSRTTVYGEIPYGHGLRLLMSDEIVTGLPRARSRRSTGDPRRRERRLEARRATEAPQGRARDRVRRPGARGSSWSTTRRREPRAALSEEGLRGFYAELLALIKREL